MDWGLTAAQIFLTTFGVFAGYGLGIQRGREIQRKIQQRIVARLMEH